MILVSLILLTFCHLEFFLVLICLCILCHYMCSYEGRKFAIKILYLVCSQVHAVCLNICCLLLIYAVCSRSMLFVPRSTVCSKIYAVCLDTCCFDICCLLTNKNCLLRSILFAHRYMMFALDLCFCSQIHVVCS